MTFTRSTVARARVASRTVFDPEVTEARTPLAARLPMRDPESNPPADRPSNPTTSHDPTHDPTRAPDAHAKDRERKRPRYDTRTEGDPDNPLICRGVD